MATTPTKAIIEDSAGLAGAQLSSWQPMATAVAMGRETTFQDAGYQPRSQPSGRDALQALLAFSALHQQVRRRRALASQHGFETIASRTEFEAGERFVLDEVLQLVAERAIAITGADGLGIALAENNEIVLRASAGTIKPDVGQRIQRDSAFSGACFRTAQIIRCDDTETDDRVNLYACRQLGARSMVAVPLCGRRRVIGLLEAFSVEPFGFNDSDVCSLELLAELILGALKPEDEDRFAQSAEVAEAELAAPATAPQVAPPAENVFEKVIEKVVVASAPAPEVAVETKVVSVENASAISLPAPALAPAAQPKIGPKLKIEPERVADDAVAPQIVREIGTSSRHRHPVLVLVLVVVAAVLAGGIWWKLKNAQLDGILVKPEPKITRPGAATKLPAGEVAPSSVDSSNTSPDGQSNSAAATDADSTAEPLSGSVTPQELAKLPRVTGIRHWSSADASTVVLDLEDQVQYEAHRLTGPDRIYFDLHDTALSPEFVGKTSDIGDALLARVRVAQPVSGLTRVVLETRGNSNFSVSLEPNPYRLVVQVRRLGADTKAVSLFPGAEAEKAKLAIVVPPPTREDLQLRARVPKMRIVVDAGHGGWDLGTVGKQG